MKSTGQNPRNLLVTIALASAAVAYVMFGFLPGQESVAKLRSDLRSRQQFIIESEHLKLEIKQASEELNEAFEFAKRWHNVSPSHAELPKMFGTIAAFANESGVKITTFKPRGTDRFESIQRMTISIHCEGSFDEMFGFIRKIEEMPTTVWIGELNLQKRNPLNSNREAFIRTEQAASDSIDVDREELSTEIKLIVFADNDENSD